ncbi:MAG: pSer/pThr/pTyr-binding forkhead associated (FHA) protein, partial [Myxococcota bacterium]
DDNGDDGEVRIERDGEPVMVGRRSGATIKVRNPSVSGKHCVVQWMEEEVIVRDLGSSNGTFINANRVRRGELQDGDILRAGRFELRVSFVEHKDLAQAEYDEWGDDDWQDDEFDTGPPRYHIIYADDRGQLTGVTMSASERILAVGSEGCEINVENREVEPEHCEISWDEGVLVVTDLKTESGTFVNDEGVEDETIRNGDVVVAGLLRLHVVRACSSEMKAPSEEYRSEHADVWARHLEGRDDELELLFIEGEEHDDGGRNELSIWGNGECRMEVVTESDRYTIDGRIDRDLRRMLYDALLRSSFPDVKTDKVRAGEAPPELNLFQGKDEARIFLGKKLTQRSPQYHEVVEMLRAIVLELGSE